MIRYARRLAGLAMVLTATVAAPTAALAHPHVWVTMKDELVYAADGSVTGIRHAWTFDEMFSTFATQGIDSKQKGIFTHEDLAPLADVNIKALKDTDYFTKAEANGQVAPFDDPTSYYLDFKDGLLTLFFTLPFKAPVKAHGLKFEVYDPTWFVDFSFDEKDPVELKGAPAQCQLKVVRPDDGSNRQQSDEFFNSTESASTWAAQFANWFSVNCP